MADGLARVTDLPGVCLVTAAPARRTSSPGSPPRTSRTRRSSCSSAACRSITCRRTRSRSTTSSGCSVRSPSYAVQVTQARSHPGAAARGAAGGDDRASRARCSSTSRATSSTTRRSRRRSSAPERYRPTIRSRRIPTRSARPRGCCAQAERPLLLVGGGVTRAGASDAGRPARRAARHPDDHRVRPQRRGAERASALPRAARPRGRRRRRRPPAGGPTCCWSLGSRLGQFTTHFDDRSIKPDTAIVQVDIESRDIGRYYPVAVGIQADARETCAALAATRSAHGWRGRQAAPSMARGGRRSCASSARRGSRRRRRSTTMPMKPQRVYAELRRALPPDTIVTLDAGAAPAYGYDRLHFARPRTFLTPLDLGGLGFAFPVALGAKLGRPEAPVRRDPRRRRLPDERAGDRDRGAPRINAVTLVMNNNCWGSEKAYQKAFYDERYIGCDIGNPRYDELRAALRRRRLLRRAPGPGRRRDPRRARRRQARDRRDPDRPERVPGAGHASTKTLKLSQKLPRSPGAAGGVPHRSGRGFPFTTGTGKPASREAPVRMAGMKFAAHIAHAKPGDCAEGPNVHSHRSKITSTSARCMRAISQRKASARSRRPMGRARSSPPVSTSLM